MMPLFEKILTGNESPNQIVVVEKQEVGEWCFCCSSPPLLFSEFRKLYKMGKVYGNISYMNF